MKHANLILTIVTLGVLGSGVAHAGIECDRIACERNCRRDAFQACRTIYPKKECKRQRLKCIVACRHPDPTVCPPTGGNPGGTLVTVPSLTNRSLESLAALLPSGLVLGAVHIRSQDATAPPTRIVGQSLTAGTTVARGSTIDVDVVIPTDSGEFLSRTTDDPAVQAAQAAAYYDRIDPCGNRRTLETWKAANGFTAADEAQAGHYINDGDLGFGRRMVMHSADARHIAYYVQNFTNKDAQGREDGLGADRALDGRQVIATVAMEFSPGLDAQCHETGEPFIKFFTFRGDGGRTTFINLDDRDHGLVNPDTGRREAGLFQPQMCTSCHGGDLRTMRANGDIGSQFILFDPASFHYSPTDARAQRPAQEDEFRRFNQGVLATRPQDPRDPVREVIEGWYAPNLSRPTANTDFRPAGWDQDPTQRDLYDHVVKTSCRSCHLQRDPVLSFSTFQGFNVFKSAVEADVCRSGRMPFARRTFEHLWASTDPYRPGVLRAYLGVDSSCR